MECSEVIETLQKNIFLRKNLTIFFVFIVLIKLKEESRSYLVLTKFNTNFVVLELTGKEMYKKFCENPTSQCLRDEILKK